MKVANNIKTFKELQTKSIDGTVEQIIKEQISEKLNHYNIKLDDLILNNKNKNDEMVISAGGQGKNENEQVEFIDTDNSILNKLCNTNNNNNKILNLLVQIQKEHKQTKQQHGINQETKQADKNKSQHNINLF